MLDKETFINSMEHLFGTEKAIGLYFYDPTKKVSYTPEEIDALNEQREEGNYLALASYLKNGEDAVLCTSHARLVLATLVMHNVQIWGFENKHNPESKFALDQLHPGGHDFAMVSGRFIVDPWLLHIANHPQWIFDLNDRDDRDKAFALYGNSSNWQRNNKAAVLD